VWRVYLPAPNQVLKFVQTSTDVLSKTVPPTLARPLRFSSLFGFPFPRFKILLNSEQVHKVMLLVLFFNLSAFKKQKQGY
jgi:hypothetical protein